MRLFKQKTVLDRIRAMNILVINGPNLNMLGNRDPKYYGTKTLDDALEYCRSTSDRLNIRISTLQSNYEGDIVKYVQDNSNNSAGILVNAGALTHYSHALSDALVDSKLPVVEIHISNVHARGKHRSKSVISSVSIGQVSGLGWRSYAYALELLVEYLREP